MEWVLLTQGAQVWEGSLGRHSSLPQKFILTVWVALHWGHHTASQANRSQGIFSLKERGVLHYVSKVKCMGILYRVGAKATQTHCGVDKSRKRWKRTPSGASIPHFTQWGGVEAGRRDTSQSELHIRRKVAGREGSEAESSRPTREGPHVSRALWPQATDIVV